MKPVDDYLDEEITINGVTLSCDIYRVEPNTVLTPSVFTGCIANDANTQIIIGCNLSVASGTTFTPPYRCKGVIIADVGTFTNAGTISMTARGASGEGKNIKLTADYQISAVGGNANSSPASGVLSCAGGGNGGNFTSYTKASGGAGTSFSGGAGGGGTGASSSYIAQAGSSTGGAGGNGYCTADANAAGGGGAGNPGGTKATHGSGTATNGSDGTGGLLVIIANKIINSGTITSEGSTGGNAYSNVDGFGGSGGGSGGGCVVLLSKSSDLTGTVSVAGGSAGTSSNAPGNAGGTGVYAHYDVNNLDIVDLDVNFVITDDSHLNNVETSEKLQFITLLDKDELVYDALGKRHRIPAGGGSTGGGHVIEDNTGTEVTQRDTMKFVSPLNATDDSTDEVTEITVDDSGALDFTQFTPPSQMASGVSELANLDDVNFTNPQDGDVFVYDGTAGKWKNGSAGHEYSTTEKVVGTWVDGRPLYEKVVTINNPSNGWTQIDLSSEFPNASNIDFIMRTNEFILRDDLLLSSSFIYSTSNNKVADGFSALFGIFRSNNQPTLFIICNVAIISYTFVVQYTKTTDTPSS